MISTRSLLQCGVAVDGDDNILVVDGNNHRILKFIGHGKFLTAVGQKGTSTYTQVALLSITETESCMFVIAIITKSRY